MPKSKKIILDVQHMGKPHRPLDRGAVCENLVESYLCLEYASMAFKALTAAGHKPYLVTSGYYGSRARFANDIGADLYFALHLNSSAKPPTTHYGLVEISEHAGNLTRSFAEHLVETIQNKLPVDTARVKEIREGKRGWSCINRVGRASAFLFEPLFLNHPDSERILKKENIWIIGDVIVSAVKTFDWQD